MNISVDLNCAMYFLGKDLKRDPRQSGFESKRRIIVFRNKHSLGNHVDPLGAVGYNVQQRGYEFKNRTELASFLSPKEKFWKGT